MARGYEDDSKRRSISAQRRLKVNPVIAKEAEIEVLQLKTPFARDEIQDTHGKDTDGCSGFSCFTYPLAFLVCSFCTFFYSTPSCHMMYRVSDRHFHRYRNNIQHMGINTCHDE